MRTKSKKSAKKSVSVRKTKGISKNEKIRRLLSKGKTVSEIADKMDLTYQRVKNVEIAANR